MKGWDWNLWGCLLVIGGVLLVPTPAEASSPAGSALVTYETHVRAIFRQHCFSCHGPEQQKSDLALDRYSAAIEGGASGEVLFADDLESSRLWLMVTHEDSAMPPDQDKLPQEKLDTIRAWIEGGLLQNTGSPAVVKKPSGLTSVQPSADNRPVGEPAMPVGLWEEPIVTSPRADAVTALAASPWAPLVAVAGQRQISFYHTETAQLLGIVPFPQGVPKVLRFSRDGSLLMAGGGQGAALGVVVLFDVKTGREIVTLGDELDSVLAADVHPDHSLVALGGPGKTIRLLSTADRSVVHEISKPTDWVTDLEFSPDGKYLVTGDRSGGLFVWEAKTARPVSELRGHKGPIRAVAWRADSQVVASSSQDATVRLWQAVDGKQIKSWTAHAGGTEMVSFARDGRLITAGQDRTVKSWLADGKLERVVTTFDDVALSARFSHDASHAVAGGWNGEVRLLGLGGEKKKPGTLVAKLPPNPPTLAVRIESAAAVLAQREQEAPPAAQALKVAQQELVVAESVIASHQTEVTQAKVQAEKQGKAREVAGNALAACETAHQQATAAHALAQNRTQEMETLLAKAEEHLAEDAQVEELKKLVSAAKDALSQASQQVQATGAQKTKAEEAQQKALVTSQKGEVAWQLAAARLEELNAQAATLPDVKALQGLLAKRQQASQAIVDRAASARRDLDAVKAKRDAFVAANETMTAELQQLTGQLEKAVQQLAKLEATERLAHETFNQQKKLLGELTDRLAKVQAEYDQAAGLHKQAQEEEKAKVAASQQARVSVDKAKEQADAATNAQAQFAEAQKLRKQYAK